MSAPNDKWFEIRGGVLVVSKQRFVLAHVTTYEENYDAIAIVSHGRSQTVLGPRKGVDGAARDLVEAMDAHFANVGGTAAKTQAEKKK